MKLTQERLKELLHYDSETGVFVWRVKRKGTELHKVAGCWYGIVHPSGFRYRKICIDYVNYYCHKLAWLYVYGYWPLAEVDHIDGNESNDRISNLREATRAQNSYNTKIRAHNKSGYKGVRLFRGRWNARITVDGTQKHIGYFDTPVLAALAYDEAARKFHGEFARTNKVIGRLP